MSFNSIAQIREYLDTLINLDSQKTYSGNWGLDKVKQLLTLLDNPQEKYPVIHVAGTSGKSSASYLIQEILLSQGLKTGLHLSPFILDFREGFLINGKVLQESKVVGYFNQFYRQSSFLINQLNLTYHEALVCFEYFLFAEEKVQVAVVEVDLGGLFDCTNVVSSFNKICVISDIGYDHTQVLGSKISQVASQKAGIIQPKNTVIFIQQSYQTSSKIILEQAKKQRATDIIEVTNLQNSNLRPGLQPSFFQQIDTSDKKVSLNLEFQTQKLSLKTNLIGNFQAKNLALALTSSLIFLEKNTLNLDLKKLQNCLSKVQIVGKMDLKKIIYSNQEVNCILDGAHNPQKMEAFLSSLTKIFSNQKFVFVVAFKNSKDHLKMLKLICKYASYLIITKFVVGNTASQVSKVILNTEFKTIESSLKKLKFSNYSLTENYQEALELGLQKIVVKNLDANNNSQPILVFTGSIYFLGNIYPALEKFD